MLINGRHDMEIMRDEIFGRVAPVSLSVDPDEAIAKANDSTYGLTSSIYTKDLKTAMRACAEVRFGETYIDHDSFAAMQVFRAGTRRYWIVCADGKHGVYEYTHTHVVYMQN